MKFCKIAELQHAAMAKNFSASVSARRVFLNYSELQIREYLLGAHSVRVNITFPYLLVFIWLNFTTNCLICV